MPLGRTPRQHYHVVDWQAHSSLEQLAGWEPRRPDVDKVVHVL